MAHGPVAVITGAASGIGLSLAVECAARGYRVVIADIEEAALRSAVERLPADVLPVVVDVASASSVRALGAASMDRFGQVDLLVNNAGVGTVGKRIWETTEEDWRWVLGVNLMGVVNGLHAFLPGMLARDSGHIVNTASAAGLLSPTGMTPYSASKHAVVTLTESLHHELQEEGSAVGVSLLCPGLVRTNIATNARNRPEHLANTASDSSGIEAAALQEMTAAVASGRDPGEIARFVLDGVEAGRFYIIPDTWIRDAVELRLADITQQRSPRGPS